MEFRATVLIKQLIHELITLNKKFLKSNIIRKNTTEFHWLYTNAKMQMHLADETM